MNTTVFTRRLLAVLLALLAIVPLGRVHAQTLNPPPPPDAQCSTNPNGTVCHFAYARSGTNLPDWNNVVCDGFTINFTFSAAGHSEQTYDAAGNVTREIRHVGFTGTLANSTNPAKTVPYEGNFVRTMDFKANTLTFSGLIAKVSLPGGLVAKNEGRVVMDLNLPEGHDVVFVAGHFDVYPGVPMHAQPLCAALAPTYSFGTAAGPVAGLIQIASKSNNWFKFEYNYDNSDSDNESTQALVRLKMATPGCVSFEVWTPGRLRDPQHNGQDSDTKNDRVTPVGRGTPEFLRSEHKAGEQSTDVVNPLSLTWAGSARSSDTYYVIVKNKTEAACTYSLSISGPDVSF